MSDLTKSRHELWADEPSRTIRKFLIVRPANVLLTSTKRFSGRPMRADQVARKTADHFVEINKMVNLGSVSQRESPDSLAGEGETE